MALLEHNEGDKFHYTEEEYAKVIKEATRASSGLMPASSIYEGTWFEPPVSSTSAGRLGMRAFDNNYFYFYTPDGYWKRISLSSW